MLLYSNSDDAAVLLTELSDNKLNFVQQLNLFGFGNKRKY